MTKEKAKEILERYLSDQISEGLWIELPDKDEIIYDISKDAWKDYMFVYLIKILYDL